MFVKLAWSVAFRHTQITVSDGRAILPHEFTHGVICVDTLAEKVIICCGWASCHYDSLMVSHLLVIVSNLGHVLLVQNLLGKDLLHHPIAVVHLRDLWHHLISVCARVYFANFTREEYTAQVLLCWSDRCLRKAFLNSLLSIVCEIGWFVLLLLGATGVEIVRGRVHA